MTGRAALGPGTALRLMAELDDADDRKDALWREYHSWHDQGCHHETFPDALWQRIERADADRGAASAAFYGWLERPGATAEEQAARAIMDSRWPFGKVSPSWPFLHHGRRQS